MIRAFEMEGGNWVCNHKTELTLHKDNIIDNEGSIFGFGSLMVTLRDGDDKIIAKKVLTASSIFKSRPSDMTIKDDDPDTIILFYNKGDIFMYGSDIISDSVNIELLFKMLLSGKVNTEIDYRTYRDIVLNNIEINGGLDISENMISFLLSEIVRSKKNPEKPYRLNPTGEYVVLNYRTMVSKQNTFAALVHEDSKTMLVTSLNRKGDESKSPLEKYSTM